MIMVHVFIVNPMAGKRNFADSLREQISRLTDIEYYIFDTRSAGYEATLIKKIEHIFEDEKIRIYCCGGSGTFKNIINDIKDLDNVEVAFYPCGHTNDYLKTFKKEDQKRFTDIEELINGDVIDVDYIRYNNKGVCINTCSTGIDTRMVEKLDDYRFLYSVWNQLPYFLSLISALFHTRTIKCEITAGEKHYVDDFTEIFFGNGNIIGGSVQVYEDPDTTDGKGKYMLLRQDARRLWSIPVTIKMLKHKTRELEMIAEYGDVQSIYIRRLDDGPIPFNMDGEVSTFGGTIKLEIVHNGLHLVVPKGVTAGGN